MMMIIVTLLTVNCGHWFNDYTDYRESNYLAKALKMQLGAQPKKVLLFGVDFGIRPKKKNRHRPSKFKPMTNNVFKREDVL